MHEKKIPEVLAETVMPVAEALYVIEKTEGGQQTVDRNQYKNILLYESADDAHQVMRQMHGNSQRKRKVRRASQQEVSTGQLVRPKQLDHLCLVEIAEDIDARRYGIATRAASESEFIVEFAQAFSLLADVPKAVEAMRVRELLPHVVDICCKYRGYKVDSVHQRMFLVAGDVELPGHRLDESEPDS